MHNATLERIRSQIHGQSMDKPSIQPVIEISPPVSLEILRIRLQEIFVEPPKVEVPIAPLDKHFNNIYDFVAWYVENQVRFTEGQRNALNTLVQTRVGIDQGCNCKKNTREAIANEYFQTFWRNNKETDMMPTLLKALNVQKVSFGKFLTYP